MSQSRSLRTWSGRVLRVNDIVELRPLVPADAEAHCAGEDELTVRWLTGDYGTVEQTIEHFDQLTANAAAGVGKRGFGVWVGGRLGGYVDFDPDLDVDFDPDLDDGIEADDVNISYCVHPWARGRGVAAESVGLVCAVLRSDGIGARAAIRADPENTASHRVAEKAGFSYVRDFVSATDTHADGRPATLSLFLLDLNP